MSGVLIVTGGGRGIGAAVVRLAAARGYDVAGNCHVDRAAAEETAAAVVAAGRRALVVPADVAGGAAVEAMFATVAEELGRPVALVNNAGITGLPSRLDEADEATMRRVLEVNTLGVMLCAREAVRRMSTRHGGPGGAIVNISSSAATLGSPGEYVWYAASKAAVDSLTKGLALEVAAEGIRVNAVAAGLTETGMHAAMGQPDRVAHMAPSIPLGRAAAPEEIAGGVLWLLSDRASYVTGTVLRIAGGR